MFRQEAIAAKRQKLHGGVFLVQPLSFLVSGYLILAIVSLCIILLVTGSYARSEHVSGHLVPSKGLVKIQAARAGTLQSIDVEEGDTILKGQKLASILVSTSTLDGGSFADQGLVALDRQDFELQSQITLESKRLETQTAGLLAEKEEIVLRLQSLQDQLDLQRQLVKSAEDAFRVASKLHRRGFVSKEKSGHRHQDWLKQKAQEKFKEQELATAKSKKSLLEIRLLQLPDESKQRLARLMSQKAELEGRRAELRAAKAYAITATVEGRVLSSSMDSIGRSVQAGQPLLSIMPKGSLLRAELFIPAHAIGFLAKGQEVKLLYDAFPYQFFGSYPATIESVTETILSADEILAPFKLQEPVYRVIAGIENNTITARGKKIALQSGMTLKANIVLERRSFLEWMLEPLRAVGERS